MHARQQCHRSFCRAMVAPKAFMEEGRDVVRDIGGEIGKLVSGTKSPETDPHICGTFYMTKVLYQIRGERRDSINGADTH